MGSALNSSENAGEVLEGPVGSFEDMALNFAGGGPRKQEGLNTSSSPDI